MRNDGRFRSDDVGEIAIGELRPKVLQLPEGSRVKRSGLYPVHPKRTNAPGHFLRRLLGEGEGEHIFGLVVARLDAISDSVGDSPRFPRPRPSHDAHWCVKSGGDKPLTLV